MPDPHAQAEARLRQAAHRMRLGAVKLYPATEKQLEMVRQIVRQQWDQEQQHLAPSPPAEKQPPEQAPAQPQVQAKEPTQPIPPPTHHHSQ